MDVGVARQPDKTNDLADLIDLAQRANPHTRECASNPYCTACFLLLSVLPV